MPGQPRKRAPRALRAVPDAVTPEETPAPRKQVKPAGLLDGALLGKNKAHIERQKGYPLGPDMPPGLPLHHLPEGTVVPPKPKIEPTMDYPGNGHHRSGHPEWQLWTDFDDDGVAINREWRVRWVPSDEKRCAARGVGKANNWQGNRCTQSAIRGARVCRFHGGNLPNVKKAAQTALAIAAFPAAEKLIHIAITKSDTSDADRIKAIIQILDRAGVEGKQTVTLELKPWQQALQSIYDANYSGEGEGMPGQEQEEGVDYILEDDDE